VDDHCQPRAGLLTDDPDIPAPTPVDPTRPAPVSGLTGDLDPVSGPIGELDLEWEEYVAWVDREIAAGRDREPEIWECDAPAVSISLDEAAGERVLLTAICGVDAQAADGLGLRFGQGRAADVLPPGPLLGTLTEQAVRDVSSLSDAELAGVLHAARRQEIREQYKQALLVAEFARRREAAFDEALQRGVPVGCAPGGFPGEELAIELVTTRAMAAHRIEDAKDLTSRLPATLAGMAAGLIDAERAGYIAVYTRSMSPADAARADVILAEAAPDLRVDQLARKAAGLEMKLNPEAVAARKERERRTNQRVEVRREFSGNASLSAREMDTADALASQSYVKAVAVKLRNGGVNLPLGSLCVLVMRDLTQGRNPFDRLKPKPATGCPPAKALSTAQPAPGAGDLDDSGGAGHDGDDYVGPDEWPGWDPDEAEIAAYRDPVADELEDARRGPIRPGDPVPLPALINLLVPIGTLLGWGTAPAQAGSWGMLDRDETHTVVSAAARHPRSRWCVTLTNEKGEAVAHGCARGQHAGLLNELGPQPPPGQIAELLRRLNLTFAPIATGSCEHPHAEDRYAPSRRLRHLVRARSATCDAPGCAAQAVHADLDHTVPYPGGLTDECNLSPRCRAHHRAKQAPDWTVEQVAPGVTRWVLPSGRVHTTTPTRYDL
jgi:hypothetical protein